MSAYQLGLGIEQPMERRTMVHEVAPRRDAGRSFASYRIEVLGTPAAKGSSRPMLNRKTGRVFTFAGGSKTAEVKLKSWDANTRDAARTAVGELEAPPFVDVALAVRVVFRLIRPGGHWGKGKRAGQLLPSAPSHPRTKPDIDKLARSTLDSLTGIVFDDDSRITLLIVEKLYARPGEEGATIWVEEMPPP